MPNFPSIIEQLLTEFGCADIAESEFFHNLNEDVQLRDEFRQWCDEMGYREKEAFQKCCNDLSDTSESIFDTLSDYDEQ